MYTDYVGHTPTLVVSQCVRGAEVIERMNSGPERPSFKTDSGQHPLPKGGVFFLFSFQSQQALIMVKIWC
jgi:hypothetical protein